MRTFTLIWFGQLVSTIGSYMTEFALTLWAWEVTGSATALALVGFFLSTAPHSHHASRRFHRRSLQPQAFDDVRRQHGGALDHRHRHSFFWLTVYRFGIFI